MPGERTPEADMESRYYRWFAVGLACLLEGFTSGEPGVAAITLLFLLACQSELAGVWSASALCFLSLDRAGLPVTRPALLAVQVAAAALLAHRGRLVRPIPEAKGQERDALWLMSVLFVWMAPLSPWPSAEAAHWAVLAYIAGREFPEVPSTGVQRHPWLSAALACVSILVAAGLFEAGARRLQRDGLSRVRLFSADPKRIHALTPGFEGDIRFRVAEELAKPFPVRISPHGLRDRDYGAKAGNEFRILMLGDSFTFGWGMPEEMSLPRLLEARLVEMGYDRPIHVINAGVPGYGPWQCREWLCDEGFALEPDLVILQTYVANDLGDTLLGGPGLIPHLDAYDAWQLRAALRMKLAARSALVAVDDWLLRNSGTYHALLRGTQEELLLTRLLSGTRLAPVVHDPPEPERNFLHECDLAQWYPMLDTARAEFSADVFALRDDCLENGVDFLAFNVPYPLNKYKALWYFQHTGQDLGLEYELDKGARNFEMLCLANHVPFVPLLDAVRAFSWPNALDYPMNIHLSESGAELVCEVIKGYLFFSYFPFKRVHCALEEEMAPPETAASCTGPKVLRELNERVQEDVFPSAEMQHEVRAVGVGDHKAIELDAAHGRTVTEE